MHEHATVICSCGRVIAQCRCPTLGKPTRTVKNGCTVCEQRAKDADRPTKHVRVVEVAPVDVEAIAGDALPVKRIDVNLGGDRKGVIFTIHRKSVDAAEKGWLQQVGQILGNLVHPHPATLVVLPDGEELHAYEIGEA